MHAPQPQKEHQWLEQLVGEWTAEMECSMGPDQPSQKSTGSETVRSLGGLWTLGEGQGDAPDGLKVTSIMTLGYDPERKKFVGTFIASVMTHMWVYEGQLDASGKVLTLDTVGPSFTGDGKMVPYQDIIEIIGPDHRTLRSQTPGPDGKWIQFMNGNYRRTN